MMPTPTTHGPAWKLMSSGRRFDFLNPTFPPTLRELLEEAQGGLKQLRFGGCSPLTLRQHLHMTAWVARRHWYDDDVVFWSAMHDLHEVYTGDMPGPLKRLVGGTYVAIEHAIEHALADWAIERGAPALTDKVRGHVKECDIVAQQMERDRWLPEHDDWPRSTWGRGLYDEWADAPVTPGLRQTLTTFIKI